MLSSMFFFKCKILKNNYNNFYCTQLPRFFYIYFQLWDESLARSAEAWAATCIWEHGPPYLLRYLGQNLSVRTG